MGTQLQGIIVVCCIVLHCGIPQHTSDCIIFNCDIFVNSRKQLLKKEFELRATNKSYMEPNDLTYFSVSMFTLVTCYNEPSNRFLHWLQPVCMIPVSCQTRYSFLLFHYNTQHVACIQFEKQKICLPKQWPEIKSPFQPVRCMRI